MLKGLVPVDGSSNSRHAVRHVLGEFKSNPAMDIHLLNVQPRFPGTSHDSATGWL